MRRIAIVVQPYHSLGLCCCGVEQNLRRSSWESTEVCVQGVELSCNDVCEQMSCHLLVACVPSVQIAVMISQN